MQLSKLFFISVNFFNVYLNQDQLFKTMNGMLLFTFFGIYKFNNYN